MANEIALVAANRVNVVESDLQVTLPVDEAITAGMAVRLNVTTGKFTKAKATELAEARIFGIATKTVAAGLPLTVIRRGLMDGYDLSDMDYDADVYLSDTDGRLSTVAGTISYVVGRVIPVTGGMLDDDFDKVLLIDLTSIVAVEPE